MTILAFIFGVVVTFFALGIVTHCKDTQPKNNVHFYITRDENKQLNLFLGRPIRDAALNLWNEGKPTCQVLAGTNEYLPNLEDFGLNKDDYKHLTWEDEPVEVFLNLN